MNIFEGVFNLLWLTPRPSQAEVAIAEYLALQAKGAYQTDLTPTQLQGYKSERYANKLILGSRSAP